MNNLSQNPNPIRYQNQMWFARQLAACETPRTVSWTEHSVLNYHSAKSPDHGQSVPGSGGTQVGRETLKTDDPRCKSKDRSEAFENNF